MTFTFIRRIPTPLVAAALTALALATGGWFAAMPAQAQTLTGVELCQHADHEGRCQTFTANNADLRGSIVGGDTASSVRIRTGAVAALYEHDNYGGRCRTITKDDLNLHDNGFGDIVSSLRFGRGCVAPSPTKGIMLCEHDGYKGRCSTFTVDFRDLRGTIVGGDTASSVQVAPGWVASLYQDANFGGRCLNASNYTDLGNLGIHGTFWEDRISSIRVGVPCPD
jgi:hypothetical protein